MAKNDDLAVRLSTVTTSSEQRALERAATLDEDASSGNCAVLRFEATDLYGRIMDTHALSVVRGASSMLEAYFDAFDEVLQLCQARITGAAAKVQVVYTGGSQAVGLVTSDSVQAAQDYANALGRALVSDLSDDPWRWTCAYAVVDLRGAFTEALDELEDKVHLSRLAQLDVDPGWKRHAKSKGHPYLTDELDPLDGLRPVPASAKSIEAAGATGPGYQLNPANAFRFRFGQQHRFGLAEQLYALWRRASDDSADDLPVDGTLATWKRMAQQQWSPWPSSRRFAQDFQALGKVSRLQDYIALIEADGNGFGSWRSKLTTPKLLALGSALIKMAVRRTLVVAIEPELSDMHQRVQQQDATSGGPAVQQAQLLTFAGDEFVLVVPGHRGLEVARRFLEAWTEVTRALASRPEFAPLRNLPGLDSLTFRMGVVITHATTPIRHVRAAAHSLMDESAKKLRGPNGSRPHVLDWAVLKSHDVPPRGVLAMREQEPSAAGRATSRPHSLDNLQELHDLARKLYAEGFPMRQLARRAHWAATGQRGDAPMLSADAQGVLPRLTPAERHLVEDATAAAAWPDLYELMDVVASELPGSAGGAQ